MWQVIYIKDGDIIVHDYRPATRAEALGVGHELCRDGVADFFRVSPLVASYY
jgi:hypothetical protein